MTPPEPPPEPPPPEPPRMEPTRTAPAVGCAMCGAAAVEPPITWMFENDPRRGGVWYCDHCARANLRSVEAKLHQEWW